MTRQVLIVQHAPWEGPGRIATALDERAQPFDVRASEDLVRDLPEADELAGLVLLGGPMRATDTARHPGLAIERELARRTVALGIPTLGICLGHQIVGLALGARLSTGVPEIGVGTVDLSVGSVLGPAGATVSVLHWHGDVVSLPDGADLLATSLDCPNQAFRMGSAIAMQFHLELDEPMLRSWLSAPAMRKETSDPERLLADFRRTAAERDRVADLVFGAFADEVAG